MKHLQQYFLDIEEFAMDYTCGLHTRFSRQVFCNRIFLASAGALEEVERYRLRILTVPGEFSRVAL